MMTPKNPLRCVACDGPLTEGRIADFSHMGMVNSAKWTKGHPRGIEVLKNEEVYVIEAYRCESCGRLELYANIDFTNA